MVKANKTELLCSKCGGKLDFHKKDSHGALLYCDKCNKFYGYNGPGEVTVKHGADIKEIVQQCSRLYLHELS